MLSDIKLRNLKPQEKDYKVPDRDGLYVAVLTTGRISFRFICNQASRIAVLACPQVAVDYGDLA